MQLGQLEITIIGFILTWTATAVGIGVAYGRLSVRVDKNSENIAGIQKKFVTGDGEQRYMTFRAHDHICERNSEAFIGEIRHIAEALSANTIELKAMRDQVNQLTVAVAVLEEGRDGTKK